MGLPEGDVADPADPEDHRQLRPLRLQLSDPFGVMGQAIRSSKPALAWRDRQVAEWPVEGRFHRVLKGAGIVGGKRVTVSVTPFIHIESINVVTLYAPFL